MQIRHVIIKVDDQDKAVRFYTDVMGFKKKHDLGSGPDRWLSVVADAGADSTELVLESNRPLSAMTAQRALYDASFPAAILSSEDLAADYTRLTAAGVRFLGEPRDVGPVITAFFDDTCGNIINISQLKDLAPNSRARLEA